MFLINVYKPVKSHRWAVSWGVCVVLFYLRVKTCIWRIWKKTSVWEVPHSCQSVVWWNMRY